MSIYPESIARCQHIKVSGTQCASPALRRQKFCYFHKQFRQKRLEINANIQKQRWNLTLPLLEDANSIQMGLVQVMRLLLTQQIDRGTAGLMLYALQTASANLKRTSFEPELPTRVVIDRESVTRRPIGATAWSSLKGREYDDMNDKFDLGDLNSELSDARKAYMLYRLGLPPDTLTRLGEGTLNNGNEELVES